VPISDEALKVLADAGVSADVLVAAIRAQGEVERAALKDTRVGARLRKRLQRSRDRETRTAVTHVTDVTRDPCDTPIPLPSPPTPPLTNPLTPFDDVDGRARGSPDLAARLANQAMDILGVDRANRPRLWHGFENDLAHKLAERGWRADLILVAARRVAAAFAKRTGEKHPESFGYLTKPIEREHERYQREFAMLTPVATADPAAIEAARSAQLWLHHDDERFKAWHAHLVATRGRGLPTDAKGGWHVTCDWPPGHGANEQASAA
jgi:hypothetical protein